MTPAEALATMESTFSDAWANTTPIAWGNTTPTVTGQEWVRFSVVHGESELRSWSGTSRTFNRPGIIFVQIFVPIGTGTRRAVELGYKALTALEGKKFGPLDLMTGSIAELGNTDASHYQIQVRVHFQYDEIRVA